MFVFKLGKYFNQSYFFFRLETINQPWIDWNILSRATALKGSPLENLVGFIDGTVTPTCRPKYLQKPFYNGHKRVHGLKFQSVVIPNGIILNMFGPMTGNRHDAALLRESGLLPQLDLLGNGPNQHPYCLYGDQAYPNRPTLIVPYKGRVLTRRQKAFNNAMKSFRISVEWGFKDVTHLFTSLDFKYGLKLYQNQVAKMYLVGTLLTNCHICLYGNQTSKYFNLKPPSLEQYLY